MEEIKFNMNDYVKVKLTQTGKTILFSRHESLRKVFPKLNDYELKLDEEGYYKTQLHDLFYEFGSYMHMGATELPFETNIILVKSSTPYVTSISEL